MRHARAPLPPLALVIFLAGCFHGPKVDTFAPAQQPEGIHATIEPVGSDAGYDTLEGELLAVQDGGLVLRSALEGIVFIPFSRIADGEFRQKRSLRIGAGRTPGADKQTAIRLLSRFPQGLEGAVLHRLLALHGQSELKVVK